VNIQQYPFGFLSLLNAKSTGLTPSQLEDRVRPTLEMLGFYLASIPLQTAGDTVTGVSSSASPATVTVPPNQAWEVVAAHSSVSNPSVAVPIATVNLSLIPPSGSSCSVASYAGSLPTVGTDYQILCSWSPPQPQIFGPGTAFKGSILENIGATTVDVLLRVIYRPLEI